MTERPLEFHGVAVLTLRQIDRLNAVPKGTAFRAFKRARDSLREGRDFFRVDAAEQPGWIGSLKRDRLVYESSVHLVLIARDGYRAMGLAAAWPAPPG